MTLWKKRTPREQRSSSVARDLSDRPSDAEIEALLGADVNNASLNFDGLIFAYLEGELSAAHRQRVEQRLLTDSTLRARTERLTPIWSDFPDLDRAGRAEAMLVWQTLDAHIELERQGIEIPSPYRRPPYGDRGARRPCPDLPVDPREFVEFVGAELGTDAAAKLVEHALNWVFHTGKPDRWIVEVWHARQRGDLSPAVAHYLITRFAVSAVLEGAKADPVLSRLTAQKRRIEREHGLGENEHWDEGEGTPEWQEVDDEWSDRFARLFTDVFLRIGDRDIAETCVADEWLYTSGEAQIFGDQSG
jgi:hypothetical protein